MMKTQSKGIAPVIAAVIVLGLISLSVVSIGLATDFQFSVFGGSPVDCDGEVVTNTLEGYDSKEAVINGLPEANEDVEDEEDAEEMWEKHNFRVADGEVKYDVCRN